MPLPPITIRAHWDDEAAVWVVSCDEVPGLNIEAERFSAFGDRVRAALGDLAQLDPFLTGAPDRPLAIRADWL